MKDIKAIVAENLICLRKNQGLTQAQLAEKFNYSDKAVCRWERGETLPDLNVLYSITEFYGVTMNDLVREGLEPPESGNKGRSELTYRILISILLVAVVWFTATVFFTADAALNGPRFWIVFLWAVPVSCVLIALCFRRRLGVIFKTIIYSFTVWSVITALFVHLLAYQGINIWMIFIMGVPLEFVVILWQQLKRIRNEL